MDMPFEFESDHSGANIKVIGVGGGGGNAVEHMIANQLQGVGFVCANTDAQALGKSSAPIHIQLGGTLTRGLGAGADPEIGRAAAIEDRDRIREVLEGTDMVFITTGMGGGTGTGASPIIAEMANELGILTVAVVTRPFQFEGKKRIQVAALGIEELACQVDSLIVVPNERLTSVLGRGLSLNEAFAAANNVLLDAVQGISELILCPGMINVDFADVRTVMSEKGRAIMGVGRATGENRAVEAAKKAINCPLLEDVDLHGARAMLVNVTTGPQHELGMDEFETIGDTISEFAAENAQVIPGAVTDEDAGAELRVIVIATGLGDEDGPARGGTGQLNGGSATANGGNGNGGAPRLSLVDSGQREAQAVAQEAAPAAPAAPAPEPAPAMPAAVSASADTPAPDDARFGDIFDVPAYLRARGREPEPVV